MVGWTFKRQVNTCDECWASFAFVVWSSSRGLSFIEAASVPASYRGYSIGQKIWQHECGSYAAAVSKRHRFCMYERLLTRHGGAHVLVLQKFASNQWSSKTSSTSQPLCRAAYEHSQRMSRRHPRAANIKPRSPHRHRATSTEKFDWNMIYNASHLLYHSRWLP